MACLSLADFLVTSEWQKIVLLVRFVAEYSTLRPIKADALGIAPSTCLLRLEALKESGGIEQFTPEVNAELLGMPRQALVSVRLRPGARHLITTFVEELRKRPEIPQLFVLGGADDFLIHITARDTNHIREFVLEHLSSNPAVAGTRTNLVFDHARGTSPI